MEVHNIIRKYALKNAYEYGKADVKAVISKVIAEAKIEKNRIKDLIEDVKRIVEEVNKMSKDEIEKELSQYTFVEIKKERKLLHGVRGKVVTRFPPEPSGYLHIGHAKAVFLDYEAAKEHEGYMILRFDDTNPKKESWEYVYAIEEDLKWLGVEWKKKSFSSDYMELFYQKAKELFEKSVLYVSTSSYEEIRKARKEKRELKERNNSIEKNLELWDRMLSGAFDEGEAVVLLKGDMKSNNTTLRDPTMFRIIKDEHYKQGDKYIVWPTYDFAAPILDSIEGVTHAMRSKEYELRKDLYYFILDALNLRKPELIHFSRLEIRGTVVSKRFLTPLVKEGKVWGWDDPRLPTIRGLRRRGIHPVAIKEFALRFGIGKQEKTVGWEFLLKENRKVLDDKAKRLFFIKDPVKIVVKSLNKKVSIPLHPTKNMGFRELEINEEILIEKSDANGTIMLKGTDIVIEVNNNMAKLSDKKPEKAVQFIPSQQAIPCKVYIPKDLVDEKGNFREDSIEVIHGVVEKFAENIEEGDIVQFERFGFVRLDNKENMSFIFSS